MANRGLQVTAGLVILVALGAGLFAITRSGSTPATEQRVNAVTSAPATTRPPPIALTPTEVVASSELEGLHATHLIDDDPESYWNDASLRGEEAELIFRFDPPVIVTAIELLNVADEEKFKRNYRIRSYEIHMAGDELAPVRGQLADSNKPQRMDLPFTVTDELIIHPISTYPAESRAGEPPFDELALAEVRFFGSPAP